MRAATPMPDSDDESDDDSDDDSERGPAEQPDPHRGRHEPPGRGWGVPREQIERTVRQAREQAAHELERAEEQLGHEIDKQRDPTVRRALEEARKQVHAQRERMERGEGFEGFAHMGEEMGRIGAEAAEQARQQAQDAREQAERWRAEWRQQAERWRREAHEQGRDIEKMAREQAREAMEQMREAMQAQGMGMHMKMKDWKHKMKHDHERADADSDDDELPAPPAPPTPPSPPTPRAQGTAVLPVGGPVSFHLETQNGDVEIVGLSTNQIALSGPGCQSSNVRFDHSGEDVDAELDVNACQGPLRVNLPTGSEVHVSTLNGNITLRGAFGDVGLEAISGDITVDRAANAEVSTVNGNVTIRDATGRVKAETVSGDGHIGMSSPAPRLSFSSTSGNLGWSGLCGRGCRLEAELHSGDVELKLDPRSSFALKFSSQSGELKDDLGLAAKPGRGDRTRGSFGAGEGQAAIETFSGNLHLVRR
jgi:hypothetical protein